MKLARMPMTPLERRRAFRKIERASAIVRHGSLITLPILPFMCCFPLGPVAIIWLVVPVVFFKFIHSYFAEAADDVFDRQPRPLFIAMTISALLTAVTLIATAALGLHMASVNGDADRWLIMVLPLSILGGCFWMLMCFIEAWNAMAALRVNHGIGFEVYAAASAEHGWIIKLADPFQTRRNDDTASAKARASKIPSVVINPDRQSALRFPTMPASEDIERLVRDAADLTGGALPSLLSDASPTLALAGPDEAPGFYLIGLIGGKDVGKSSLAHAIAGVTLGTPSNTGEGTREAIAYVHRDVEAAVGELLSGIVPDRFQLVVHAHASLRSQVLIDLPDIDSKYQDHVELTRTVLRHLLYPIFVQSVEKYADERPQRLLAQVAEGNDPSNFLFCLNKIDQLVEREGDDAVLTIAADHGRRVQTLLSMPHQPRVFCISTREPTRFDLPALRETLSRDRTQTDVRRSRELALGRRQATLLGWLESQRFDEQLERADRITAEARELAEAKLLGPIDTRVLPRLRDEANLRAEIVEAASRRRIARWPIVNVVDVLIAPIVSVFRRNVLGQSTSLASVRAVLSELTPPLDANLRSLFADVRRRDPSIAEAYGHAPPWEDEASEACVAELTTRLTDAAELRKKAIADRAGRGHGSVSAPLRWLLTFGAALWFPIIQPVAAVALNPDYTWAGWTWRTAWQLVSLFGTFHLLHSATFLLIYFTALWATLRYLTARKTERLINRLDAAELDAAGATLSAQASAWVDSLFAPIEARSAELRDLVHRVEAAKSATRAA